MRQRRPYMASTPKPPKPKKQPAKERRKGGRPSDYTDELVLKILDRIAGGESLPSICRDKAMPNRDTIYAWLMKHAPFRERFTLARELRADVYFDQILEIADDPTGDVVANDGKRSIDWENVQRSRLRVDARKWICARMNPKKYGERITTEHTGSIDTAPQKALLPSEVAAEFSKTLDHIEWEMGFKPNPEISPAARIQAILDSGQPIPPQLYAIVLEQREKAKADAAQRPKPQPPTAQ